MSADSITSPTPADKLERSDWVEMQLGKSFMLNTRRLMPVSLVLTWAIAAVLYEGVPTSELLTWLILSDMAILFRYLVVLQYQSSMRDVSGPALRAFLGRYDVLWMLSGILWGASSFLFFGKSSGIDQFICGMILIAVSGFSVYSYASRLRSFFLFTTSLAGVTVAVFIYRLVIEQALPSTRDGWSLIFFPVVFQMMVSYFGVGFHLLQKRSLQLQFDNARLIQSLTAKSAAALEAVENKNRFIANAAHDLRQPVHALNLYASWLVDDPQLSHQVAPQIVRCTHAVNELFNSLFDFSGMNTDTPTADLQDVNLSDVLVDVYHQYAAVAHERALRWRLRTSSDPIIARSDPVLLKRLLGNLISNALKNTEQGGVLLALRQHAGQWRIEVWDTGVGIEPKQKEAIFKEFYRVPRQGTEDGFGLGLAIASRLGQILGLVVRMRSRPARGSVFWIEASGEVPASADRGQVTKGPVSWPGDWPVNGS